MIKDWPPVLLESNSVSRGRKLSQQGLDRKARPPGLPASRKIPAVVAFPVWDRKRGSFAGWSGPGGRRLGRGRTGPGPSGTWWDPSEAGRLAGPKNLEQEKVWVWILGPVKIFFSCNEITGRRLSGLRHLSTNHTFEWVSETQLREILRVEKYLSTNYCSTACE